MIKAKPLAPAHNEAAAQEPIVVNRGEYLLFLNMEGVEMPQNATESAIRGKVIDTLVNTQNKKHEGMMRAGAYISAIDVKENKPNEPAAITYRVDNNQERIRRVYEGKKVKDIYPFVTPEIADSDNGVSKIRAVVLDTPVQATAPSLTVV